MCVAPGGDGVTLLGRVGRTLARLTGNGFLRILDGKAFVVSSIPLRVSHLWHTFLRSAGGVSLIGDPKPFPFAVVSDAQGNQYAIRGKDNAVGIHMWNPDTATWETVSPDKIPIEVSRQLAQTIGVELVGFEPIPVLGGVTNVRELKALSGAGIVYLERVAVASVTQEGCAPCPGTGFAYVAKVLAFPTIIDTPGNEEVGRHRLVYSNLGLRWEPSQLEVTDGQDGILGNS